MKKYKFFALAFAALTLGACSSDDVVDNGQGGTVPAGEPGYVSLAINLPTQPSSRANDNFDDGLPVEYNVEDAYLLTFSGATEDAAKFTGAYKLTLPAGEQVGGNITSVYQMTQQITKPLNAGDNIYALVMVNAKKKVVLTEGSNSTTGWEILGNPLTAETTTVANVKGFKNAVALSIADVANASGEGYFYMTNAPLYTAQGGAVAPTGGDDVTLTEIDPNNVYSTQAEAEANPAASVYVERGVAKITVNNEGTSGTGSLTYTFNGWALDITNNFTYALRNTTNANWWSLYSRSTNPAPVDLYRFVGSAPVAAGLYRTYWGVDPNYSTADNYLTNGAPNDGIFGTCGSNPTNLIADGGNGYCLENTFDVDNMNQNQTTRVIVSATLDDLTGQEESGDFFTINNIKETLYNKTGIDNAIKAAYLANADVIAELTDADTGLKAGDENKIGAADLDVTYVDGLANGGYIDVAEVTIKAESATKFKTDKIPDVLAAAGNDAIINAINDDYNIGYYKGGVSYYPIMVQHFGDESTPWTAGSTSYPTLNRDDNYLGRWGVLRNNWYEINVTSINNIGYPEVPEVGGTPDDPVESWISVEINVLSWAKRTQDADL